MSGAHDRPMERNLPVKPPSGLVTQPCVRVSRMSPTCCVMRSEIKLGGDVGSVWLKGVYILLIGQTRAWKFSLPHTPTTNPMLVGLDRSEFGRGVDCAKPSPIWPSDSQMGCWKMVLYSCIESKSNFEIIMRYMYLGVVPLGYGRWGSVWVIHHTGLFEMCWRSGRTK